MQTCWTTLELRPKITQIELMLDDLMKIYKNMNFDNKDKIVGTFDERWNNLKPNTIVKTDNHITDIEDSTSCSLQEKKNLNGSLNNLLESSQNNDDMESWLENLATNTDDISYIRGVHDAMNDLDNVIALENVSSSESSHRPSPAPPQKTKLEFKLGPTTLKSKNNDNNKDSLQYVPKTSSSSETEDENWKKKVEKGVYSEKVRQKSRSVTDLMVLTHIDCSESESETPLQSLDYRVNYKNVRLTQNVENPSMMYGSEGNLLSVKETFQEELRKLREERKDSLLFVPVKSNEGDSLPKSSSSLINTSQTNDDKDTQKSQNVDINVMQDLSNVNDLMKPYQVYNVYNVTVESKFQPEFNSGNKLSNIINFHDLVRESKSDNTEKLPDIISDIQDNLTSTKYKLKDEEEISKNQNVDSNVQISLGDTNNINYDDNVHKLSGNVSNNCPSILDINHIDLNLDEIENLESSPNVNNNKIFDEFHTGNVESHLTNVDEISDTVQNKIELNLENATYNRSDESVSDDLSERKELENVDGNGHLLDCSEKKVEEAQQLTITNVTCNSLESSITNLDGVNKHDSITDISTKEIVKIVAENLLEVSEENSMQDISHLEVSLRNMLEEIVENLLDDKSKSDLLERTGSALENKPEINLLTATANHSTTDPEELQNNESNNLKTSLIVDDVEKPISSQNTSDFCQQMKASENNFANTADINEDLTSNANTVNRILFEITIDENITKESKNCCNENTVHLEDVSNESSENVPTNNMQNDTEESIHEEQSLLSCKPENRSSEDSVEINLLKSDDNVKFINSKESTKKRLEDFNASVPNLQVTESLISQETNLKDNAELNLNSLNIANNKEEKTCEDNSIIFGSCSDYTIDLYSGLKTSSTEAEELQFSSNFNADYDVNCLNYSLDSWDTFLDKTLDKQYDNYNSESTSLNFVQIDNEDIINEKAHNKNDISTDKEDEDDDILNNSNMNKTYTLNSETFIIDGNNGRLKKMLIAQF